MNEFGLSASADDVDHDHGDVVRSTLAQRLGNELVADKLDIVDREERFCDIALWDIAAETIGAQ